MIVISQNVEEIRKYQKINHILNCDLKLFRGDILIVAIRNTIQTEKILDFFCNYTTFVYRLSQKLFKFEVPNKH